MLSTGKPSTIYRGELSCVMEPEPRTRILISASGSPSVAVTCTPAILPERASLTVVTGTAVRALLSMEETDPMRSLRFTVA